MDREGYKRDEGHASVWRMLLMGKMFLYILVFQFLTLVFRIFDLVRSTDRLSSFIRLAEEVAGFLRIDISSFSESLENIAYHLDMVSFVCNLMRSILPLMLILGCFLIRFGANQENRQWMIHGVRLCEWYCILMIVVHLSAILVLSVLVNIVTAFSLWVLVVIAVILAIGVSIFRYVYFGRFASILRSARECLSGTSVALVYSPYVVLMGRVWFVIQIIGALRDFPLNAGTLLSKILLLASIPEFIAKVCTAICVLLVSELLSAYRKRVSTSRGT